MNLGVRSVGLPTRRLSINLESTWTLEIRFTILFYSLLFLEIYYKTLVLLQFSLFDPLKIFLA
jgi:hypothetical protein